MLGRLIFGASRRINNWRWRRAARCGLIAGKNTVLYGFPVLSICPGSRIEIGDDVVLCSDTKYTALSLDHPIKLSTNRPGAIIQIGSNTGISGGTIVAANRISIGREVLIGANVVIVDTDFHPVAAKSRRFSGDENKIAVKPVEISDNVFIGTGSIILRGTKIGRNSVVGAGSVVSGEFGENVIIAGNPARIIGSVPEQ